MGTLWTLSCRRVHKIGIGKPNFKLVPVWVGTQKNLQWMIRVPNSQYKENISLDEIKQTVDTQTTKI